MLEIDVQASIGLLELNIELPGYAGTTVVIGPNGAGKSSFLKSILGVIKPHGGLIRLDETTLCCPQDRIFVPTEERRIGYVPQRYGLFARMSVFDNVAFGMRNIPKRERHGRVTNLLKDLGISHLARRKARQLSGGESQRVALARALAIRPRALLLDEPMAALDAGARRKVRSFLSSRLRAIGIPTIVVSHDSEDVVALGGRVAVIERGQVVQIGSVDELRAQPATEFVREFLDESPPRRPSTVSEIRAWT